MTPKIGLAFAAAFSLVSVLVTPGRAATPVAGTLDTTTTAVTWQGAEFKGATYASSGVLPQDRGVLCFDPNNGNQPYSPPRTSGPSACDVYTLTINVAPTYWQSHGGGVTVDLSGWKANADGATDDIDLYIYKHNAVNQDAVGNGKDQFQPAIAITDSGQINVSYFDRRNDPDNFFIDTYLSRSSDAGAHWTDTRVTSDMSNPQVNPPIDGGGHHFYGDYQGLVADDQAAIPFFNATFLANLPTTDPQYSPWQEVFRRPRDEYVA